MVTAPDRVLLTGSRSTLRETRGREADAVAEQHRQYVHQDLVDEPPLQALTGDVGAEDLQVLAARSVQCGGDRFPDVTGEDRDVRVRRLQRPMGEEEHGSGEGVVDAARLRRPPSGRPRPRSVGRRAWRRWPPRSPRSPSGATKSERHRPVHRVTGTGDEAVERHRPVHDHLAAHRATTTPGALTSRSGKPMRLPLGLVRVVLDLELVTEGVPARPAPHGSAPAAAHRTCPGAPRRRARPLG